MSVFPLDPIVVTPPTAPRLDPVVGPTRFVAPSGSTSGQSFSTVLASALAPATPVASPSALPAAPLPSASTPAGPTTEASAIAQGSYANLTGDLDASPELLTRLNRMAAARGERWTVTSGLRTDAEQAELWANRASNPYPVAKPGTSIHRTGLGADVTIGGRPIQDVIPAGELRAAGVEPLVGDAVHVQLAGTLR